MADKTLGPGLAQIVREIRSHEGVGQAAIELATAARDLLENASGAGVTLARRQRDLATAAATSDVVRMGDRLQYELGEGPCLEAVWEEEQVYSGDLAVDDRWPRWAPKVVSELGVQSMLCIQLFTTEDRLGALNIYAEMTHAFDAEDLEVARLLAAHGAVAVAAAEELHGLKVALDRRTTIGKALGIVMARYDLDDDQAMSVLRRLSSHQNRKLFDVATEIVRERALPGADGE